MSISPAPSVSGFGLGVYGLWFRGQEGMSRVVEGLGFGV
jgi:hypothetical protein